MENEKYAVMIVHANGHEWCCFIGPYKDANAIANAIERTTNPEWVECADVIDY